MSKMPRKVKLCTTHHICDCLNYKLEQMEIALRMIQPIDHPLIQRLCDKGLNCLENKDKCDE